MRRNRLTQVLAAFGVALLVLASGTAASGGAGHPQTSLDLPTTFTLSARQAEEVSVAVRFVQAFNQRQLRAALALLTRSADVSDCDYRRVRAIEMRGRSQVTRWLRQRFRDRDDLQVARISNANPEQPTGVVAIDWARRTSNTLRSLGFPTGIKPQLGAKVIFTTTTPIRISRFANGPVGGSPELCRPQTP
jgi:hypothetical protein